MTVRVVVVRPWVEAHGGGGCCGGTVRDGVAPAPLALAGPRTRDHGGPTSEVYRRLRRDHPGVDVQVTPADNVWLLGWAFRRVRPERGPLHAARAASVAMRPGAVLVDGVAVASVEDGGAAVSSAVAQALGEVRA
ncbi:hypothetical protein KLP28_16365 [Nocardioidaceae bacterium]|nr:hypothetical protein KLP28_16365 [Nocardioidaceae bacterium]